MRRFLLAIVVILCAIRIANATVREYDIAVTLNAANRLQVFAVGANSGQVYTGELLIAADRVTIEHDGVVGWLYLGGPSDTLQLAVGKNTDGSLELFALKADGRVWHTKQVGQSWGQWSDIGAVDWKQIIIGTNADGRLEVFALVNGGQAVHIWQTSPSGAWSASAFFSRTGWKALAVGPNADGRLELFAVGSDNSGYHLWQVAPNNGWNDWVHLGGVDWKEITVIPNPDGRLELFILADGDAFHMWQTPITDDHCQPFVDALKAAQQRLQADLDDPNRTGNEIKADRQAVSNAENGLNQCRANPPFAYWSGSVSFGAHDLRQIGVARNADGRLELFGAGGDGSIYHIWMTAPNNGWIGQWSNLSVNAPRQFWVNTDGTGRLMVLYTRDGSVFILGQTAPNNGWGNFGFLPDPEPKPQVTLNGAPTTIKKGGSTTLSWTSSWADSLYLDHGIGFVSPNGSRPGVMPPCTAPPCTITYTITATSRGGTATDTQQITVEDGGGGGQPSLILCYCFDNTVATKKYDGVVEFEGTGPMPNPQIFTTLQTKKDIPPNTPRECVENSQFNLTMGSWSVTATPKSGIAAAAKTCQGSVPGMILLDVATGQCGTSCVGVE